MRAVASSAAYGAVASDDFVPLTGETRPAPAKYIFGLSGRFLAFSAIAGVAVISAAVTIGVTQSRKSNSSGSNYDNGCAYAGYWLQPVAIPSNYKVLMAPNFTTGRFTGSTQVTFTVNASGLACLQLHSVEHTFSSISLQSTSRPDAPAPVSVVRVDTTNERVVLGLPWTPAAGETVILRLAYDAPLNGDMRGLYLSTYTADDGTRTPLAATQFEATSARLAFPCFDEPAYKARFDVTLDAVPTGYTGLSNMPVVSTGPSPIGAGFTTVTFDTSPPLCTYLVAAVVAPVMSATNVTTGGHRVTVYAVNKAVNVPLLSYALRAAISIIPYYIERFGQPIMVPATSMIAIPDFAAGAMENPGLIT